MEKSINEPRIKFLLAWRNFSSVLVGDVELVGFYIVYRLFPPSTSLTLHTMYVLAAAAATVCGFASNVVRAATTDSNCCICR